MSLNGNFKITAEVVLIEDNLNDAELIIRVLQKKIIAQNIIHLLDGEDALGYFFPKGVAGKPAAKLPKVILLDLKLPFIDGFEILRILKEHDITRMIPIVILSSSAEPKDIMKCYRSGANAYVVKPVDYSIFCDTIDAMGKFWLFSNHSLPKGSF